MKHVWRFVVTAGVVVAGPAGLAVDNASYSGRYSAQRVKGTPTGSPDSVLEVVQSENAIEITQSDVDFPDFPAGVTAAVAGDTFTTTKYTRTENP